MSQSPSFSSYSNALMSESLIDHPFHDLFIGSYQRDYAHLGNNDSLPDTENAMEQDYDSWPMEIDIEEQDSSLFWDVPIDLSEYLTRPIDLMTKVADTAPTTPAINNPFAVTPASLRRIQEQLEQINVIPGTLNLSGADISLWSPPLESAQLSPRSMANLDFHPMFFSPEQRAELTSMRRTTALGIWDGHSSILDDMPDSMAKQKHAATWEKRRVLSSINASTPPSSQFRRSSSGSPGSCSGSPSLSRQLYEKLLRASCSPRPRIDPELPNNQPCQVGLQDSPIMFSPLPETVSFASDLSHVSMPPSVVHRFIDAFELPPIERRGIAEIKPDTGVPITANTTSQLYKEAFVPVRIPQSISADGPLLPLPWRKVEANGTSVLNPETIAQPKETHTVAIQTDDISQTTSFAEPPTDSAGIAPFRSIAINLCSATLQDGHQLVVDMVFPGSFPLDENTEMKGPQAVPGVSLLARIARMVLGW